jgi:hypothetical protein
MNGTLFNRLRGKIDRTCYAIVNEDVMRFRQKLTRKQLAELKKYAGYGMNDAIKDAHKYLEMYTE